MSSNITMYSADWCGDCRRSKRLMDSLNVEYTIIDVEADPSASEKVIEING
ncbi:MAG: glutaredoxin family protein, partial [Actinomycetota bacterium]